VEREASEREVRQVAEQDTDVDEHFREGREEAAGCRRRDLGGVHGRDHTPEAHTNSGHEASHHEHAVVDGETHEQRAHEEDDSSEDDSQAATDPVGRPRASEGSDQRVDTENSYHDLQLHVRDLQVLLDVHRRSTHHPNVYRVD